MHACALLYHTRGGIGTCALYVISKKENSNGFMTIALTPHTIATVETKRQKKKGRQLMMMMMMVTGELKAVSYNWSTLEWFNFLSGLYTFH